VLDCGNVKKVPNGLSGVIQILACTVLSKPNGSNKADVNMLMIRIDFANTYLESLNRRK